MEASINITYYKDCVFGGCVLLNYIGMLWVNWREKDNLNMYGFGMTEAPTYSSVFSNDQSINDYGALDSSLKPKNAEIICDWLISFSCITFVFILVTLVSEWNTVFYRKAIIYKRRVEDELASRRLQSQ